MSPTSSLYCNYIIPIWNWSSCTSSHHTASLISLHYSYMELELLKAVIAFAAFKLLHYSYMELELFLLFSIFKFHSYYIIPIWNWSQSSLDSLQSLALITLFLYGIGACTLFSISSILTSLHYSYMELERINSSIFFVSYLSPIVFLKYKKNYY